MKKLKAAILCLLIAFSLLFVSACSPSPEKIIKKADSYIDSSAYCVDLDMIFTSDYAPLDALFDTIRSTDITLFIKESDLLLKIRSEESNSNIYSEYILVDNKVYSSSLVQIGEDTKSEKLTADINDEERSEFLEEAKSAANVTPDDFATLVATKDKGEHVVICTNLKDASEEQLIRLMNSYFGAENATVTVSNAKLLMRFEGKKYKSVTLECEYSVTYYGKTYRINAAIGMQYRYDYEFEIQPPKNSDEYERVPYESIR